MFGLAPLAFGYWADLRINDVLERMSRSDNIDYTVIKYQRGWYSSSSEVVLEVGGEVGDAYTEYQRQADMEAIRPLRLKLRNIIHHGPFSFSMLQNGDTCWLPALAVVETHLLSVAGEEMPDQVSSVNDSYSIITRIGFSGESSTRFDISPLQRVLQDMETKVDWQGVQGKLRYDPKNRRVVVDVHAPGIMMENLGGKFEAEEWSFAADMAEVVENISVGEVSLQLGKLSFRDEGQEDMDFLLEELVMTGESEISGDVLHSHVRLELQHFTEGHQKYGPGVLSLVFRNLDIEALSGIRAQMQELQMQGVPQEQMGMMMGAHMVSLLPQLLQRRPELELTQFRLDTRQGPIQASGKVSIDAGEDVALMTPEMIKGALVVDMNLRIPGTVLLAMNVRQSRNELLASEAEYSREQIEVMSRTMAQDKVDALVANQLLQREGEHYTFTANMNNGEVRVNGLLYPVTGQ
jgi:uncharacterized protein YdgA (DUF945 family)